MKSIVRQKDKTIALADSPYIDKTRHSFCSEGHEQIHVEPEETKIRNSEVNFEVCKSRLLLNLFT